MGYGNHDDDDYTTAVCVDCRRAYADCTCQQEGDEICEGCLQPNDGCLCDARAHCPWCGQPMDIEDLTSPYCCLLCAIEAMAFDDCGSATSDALLVLSLVGSVIAAALYASGQVVGWLEPLRALVGR